MKITAISDQHGLFPEIPETDLLLIAGDLCPTMNHAIWFQESWIESTYKTWLKSLPAKEIVCIYGNHDFVGQKSHEKIKKMFENEEHIHFLQEESVELFGLKIYGLAWTLFFFDWAFNLHEDQLREKWELIPEDADIILTHGPPLGYGDKARRVNSQGFENVGSPSLLKKIEQIKPKLVVFGHIHPGYGVYSVGDTIVANASVVNETYKLNNAPLVFEL